MSQRAPGKHLPQKLLHRSKAGTCHYYCNRQVEYSRQKRRAQRSAFGAEAGGATGCAGPHVIAF